VKELVVGNAQSVLWGWYAYGKPYTYENMYVRQYMKNAEGTIRRAEGKRSDVSERRSFFSYSK
jgi:hypothetical protein